MKSFAYAFRLCRFNIIAESVKKNFTKILNINEDSLISTMGNNIKTRSPVTHTPY